MNIRERAEKASRFVYLVCPEEVAKDISDIIRDLLAENERLTTALAGRTCYHDNEAVEARCKELEEKVNWLTEENRVLEWNNNGLLQCGLTEDKKRIAELENWLKDKDQVVFSQQAQIAELEEKQRGWVEQRDDIYGQWEECRSKVDQLQAENRQLLTDCKAMAEVKDKYHELIMSVASKFPNESRHETALRYIQQREKPSTNSSACLIAAKYREG